MLTQREKEVLQCAFNHDGDYDAVAKELVLTKGTVRSYFKVSIFKKLMVNDRIGAFRAGLALGLIDLNASLATNPPLMLIPPVED